MVEIRKRRIGYQIPLSNKMGINEIKIWVYRKRLKAATLMAWRITTGKSFHSFGTAAVNERSPRVVRAYIGMLK